MLDYKNSDMAQAINEFCHVAKYRELLFLKFCEGHSYEEIGAIVGYSPQHVKTICRSYKELLMSRL